MYGHKTLYVGLPYAPLGGPNPAAAGPVAVSATRHWQRTMTSLQLHDGQPEVGKKNGSGLLGALLLAGAATPARRRLQHVLTAARFEVACMESAVAALALAAQKSFAFAVVDLELERPKRLQGLALVKKLRASHCSMRILAVTEHDSFAGVILALRAGADDLLPKPMGESELVSVLLNPPRLCRQCPIRRWRLGAGAGSHLSHLRAMHRNISQASRRLGLHRRSLQRILAKRAPRLRGS